jgi:hypothetical protein
VRAVGVQGVVYKAGKGRDEDTRKGVFLASFPNSAMNIDCRE